MKFRNILSPLVLFLLFVSSSSAINYYVATTGNDSNSGLDSANAWALPDNGDRLSILSPGDSILSYPGTYILTTTLQFKTNGKTDSNIVYSITGDDEVILDGNDQSTIIILMEGNHAVLNGFRMTNTTENALHVKSDSCIITNNFIYNTGKIGVRVEGSYNLFQKNIIAATDDDGIKNEGPGEYNLYYGNTVYNCNKIGIELKNKLSRLFNNIFAKNDRGIDGDIENICAFNDVWSNVTDNYHGGAVDSAGGISADPLFVDTAGGDFSLQAISPAIDSGFDLGYLFYGTAPDIGAIEYIPINQEPVLATIGGKSVAENFNLNFGVKAVDAESIVTLTTSALPSGATFIDNGDSTGLFDWTPTYLQSGAYEITFYATDDSSAVDSEIVTITVNEAGNQQPVLAAIGGKSAAENINLNFAVSASDIESMPALATSTLPTGAGFVDNGDGTGLFDWTPTYLQSGIYDITFYATDDSSAVDSEIVTITVINASGHFYVSPGGNDGNSGLNTLNTWATIDNGDQRGILEPGDTINILSGTYNIADSIRLSMSGTSAQKITYRKKGNNPAIIDGTSASGNSIIIIAASHIVVDSLELANSNRDGIEVQGDSNIIKNCYVHDCTADGIDIGGSDSEVDGNLVYRNMIANCGESGLENDITATNTLFHHNTCSFNTASGIYLKEFSPTARIFNNIFTNNGFHGINGAVGNKCGFNDVWNNTGGNYFGGVTDSAGGLSVNPSFSDAASGDFSILPGSPVIDKGLDLGYSFRGLAPDMGAFESGNLAPVLASIGNKSIIENNNLSFVVLASDVESIPTLTASTLPDSATFIDNGDGTGTFDWTPMYPSAGDYDVTFYATDDSSAVDSEVITITVNEATLDYIVIAPDSVAVSADSTQQFIVTGYDSGSNEANPGSISWDLTATVGTISGTGLFDATTTGVGQVIAISDLGPVDTSSYLEVIPGALDSLYIIPNRDTISTDSTRQFSAIGYDTEGNVQPDVGTIIWSVLRGIGTIDSTGLFDATRVNYGFIRAKSGLSPNFLTDTIFVIPGVINSIVITPDSANVSIGDSIQFSAVGYDADTNVIDAGTITWDILGRSGNINSSGLFIASKPGLAKVVATSSVGSKTDTTGFIDVEELFLTTIFPGDQTLRPAQNNKTILAFRIENYFDVDKAIEGFILRDVSIGNGSTVELLSNIDSLYLYYDKNNDSLLTAADSLIASIEYNLDSLDLSFAPVLINPDSGKTFLVAVKSTLYPHDGDSLDIMLITASDIMTSDLTVVAGPDTVNSFGVGIFDGMISGQIDQVLTGTKDIQPADSVWHLLTIDIPRNGYLADTLKIFSIKNNGSANYDDFDSLILYRDDGDDNWGGALNENRIGILNFTGDRWSRSGLAATLDSQTNRFYVGGTAAAFPSNGATIAFSVPINGLEVSSGNDGPIDSATIPLDTITISISEMIAIDTASLNGDTLIPGSISEPLLALELTNSYAAAVGLDSLKITVQLTDSSGATQAQLDSQIDSLLLYVNRDSDFSNISANDSLLAIGIVTDGLALFSMSNLSIDGSGGELELFVTAAMNANKCKNGNLLTLQLNGTTDIYMSQPIIFEGDFPLISTVGPSIIESFPASNVAINEITGSNIFGGQTGKPALGFVLPGNGYAVDSLFSLSVNNSGTLPNATSILTLHLWSDLTGDGFSVDDIRLGQFSAVGNYWRISNLTSLIDSTGADFPVASDAAHQQFEAGTTTTGLPVGGAVYTSGTDGPDDAPVYNTQTHLIFPSNRITAISIREASTIIKPGLANHDILSFALYNGYQGQSQFLNGFNLDNISQTALTSTYADYELGQIKLYFDDDDNHIFDDDSLVAVGHFNNGALQISGLAIELPAESLSYFYICSNFPTGMIDSDSLAVSIAGPSDFQFSASVSINGDLPIVSGGYHIVDGSVLRQYEIIEPTSQSLNPGDSSILLFAFKPAYNGNLSDILNSLIIENVGDADSSDISTLELWLDINNDSSWQDSDSLLGQFVYDNGDWTIEALNLEVDSLRSALLVIGDISTSASPDVYFRGSIPINGCEYLSDNDGPNDSALISEGVFTVSSSHLQVAGPPIKQYYSVGQSIVVNITVTNADSSPINDVTAAVTYISDSNLVTFDSSAAGPVDLNAKTSANFSFYYTSLSTGSLYWRSYAFSTTSADTSLEIQTAIVTIQTAPANVAVQLIKNIPTSVTRGQVNVFPFGIKITHPDTSLNSASLRLDSLILNIEDSDDAGLFADEVFSRMILASEYHNLTVLETVPHLSQIKMSFTQPVIIHPNEEKYFSLLIDIDSSALASHFVLCLHEAYAIPIVDNNNDQAVSIDASVSFPLKTATCRIDDASQKMVISTENLLNNKVNYGQNNIDVLKLRLRHPGASGSSPVGLTGLSTFFVDENSDTLDVSELLSRIRIRRGPVVVAEVTSFTPGTYQTEIELSSQLILNEGEIDSLILQVSILQNSSYNRFGLRISDSLSFTVRDFSSYSTLEMATDDSLTLATGSEFPINSNLATLELPALDPQVCISSVLPSTVIGGLDSLDLLEITVDYDATSNYAALQLDKILLTLFDSSGIPLDPDRLFDRIGYRLNNGSLNYQTYVELQSGAVVFRFDSSGLKIDPGDSISIDLIADIELDAPYDNFALAASQIQILDYNDSSWNPGFTFENGCSVEFPFITDIAEIILPSGRPVMNVLSFPVQLAYPGQQAAGMMSAELSYLSVNPQGDLAIDGLFGQVYRRDKNGTAAINGALIFDRINLYLDNILTAVDSTFSGDSLKLIPSAACSLVNGSAVDIVLNGNIREDAPQGNYFIQFDDSTFMHLADVYLATEIAPVLANNTYPLKTVEISLTAASLENSYCNYPNPFNPERGEGTTIGYILNDDAYIDIEIFTITGDLVNRIVANTFKTSGTHDEDKWYGLAEGGQTVVPGTYYGRITARYSDGRTENYKRKISVLR